MGDPETETNEMESLALLGKCLRENVSDSIKNHKLRTQDELLLQVMWVTWPPEILEQILCIYMSNRCSEGESHVLCLFAEDK